MLTRADLILLLGALGGDWHEYVVITPKFVARQYMHEVMRRIYATERFAKDMCDDLVEDSMTYHPDEVLGYWVDIYLDLKHKSDGRLLTE